MELGHPMTRQVPALFVGEFYILRDYRVTEGCIYVPKGSKGFVRRAAIEHKVLASGKTMNTLVQPTAASDRQLALIDTTPPTSFRPLPEIQKIWSGVLAEGCTVIANNSGCTLLEFANDGDAATVFYGDCSVARIVRKGKTLVNESLNLLEQTEARVMRAKELSDSASKFQDKDQRAKVMSIAQHEIVTVMGLAKRRDDAAFMVAYNAIEDMAANGNLRDMVYERAIGMLKDLAPAYALQLNTARNTPRHHSVNNVVQIATFRTTSAKPGKSRAEIERKKTERSEKDKEKRLKMKGTGGSKPAKGRRS